MSIKRILVWLFSKKLKIIPKRGAIFLEKERQIFKIKASTFQKKASIFQKKLVLI